MKEWKMAKKIFQFIIIITNCKLEFREENILQLTYPAIFIPFEENPGYTVVVPDLPGCVSEGNSLIEAIEMGTDAACGWILGELEEGNEIPIPSDGDAFDISGNSFVKFLSLDMDSYNV